MGTFHDTKDPLHGITVVAQVGPSVYVGRCHERDRENLLLVGVDIHHEDNEGRGEDGRSNREFLERAAKFGIWNTHERVKLKTAEVESLTPLNNFYKRPGTTSTSAPAPVAAPVAPEPEIQPFTSDSKPVHLSDAACAEVRRLMADHENQGKGLRLGVSGGGCSGLVYKVEFDEEAAGDLVVPFEGFNVYLDPKSTIYLRDITLDFQSGLTGRGFQFSNPNASNTCGCGESFSV